MRPGIEDALIQGSRIRLVLAADAPDGVRRGCAGPWRANL